MADEVQTNAVNDADYYYDLSNDAQDIDNVLTDLVNILEDTSEHDTVKRVKASEGERARFELGEGGGGGIAEIQAEHYEVIVGNGNNGAYGGSYDSDQSSNGSLYIENIEVKDGGTGSESSMTTHYIHANNSKDERFAIGNIYTTNGNMKMMPNGNFMMVETGGWLKIKNKGNITVDDSEMRASGKSCFVIDTQTKKTWGYQNTIVSIERTIPIRNNSSSGYSVDRVDMDTRLVIHDSTVDITRGALVSIHGGQCTDTAGVLRTDDYIHNTQVCIDNIQPSGQKPAEQDTQLFIHTGGQITVEENAKFHCSKGFNFQADSGNFFFNGGKNENAKAKPQIIINDYSTLIMNGSGGNSGTPETSWGPLAMFEMEGRIFSNKGKESPDGEQMGLSSTKGQIRYLLTVGLEEFTSSGKIAEATYEKIKTEWDKLNKAGEIKELLYLNTYFYSCTEVSVDSAQNTQDIQDMINAYNRDNLTNISIDDVFYTYSIIKPDNYSEVLSLSKDIKKYLTGENQYTELYNYYKTSQNYEQDFMKEINKQGIEYDSYFQKKCASIKNWFYFNQIFQSSYTKTFYLAKNKNEDVIRDIFAAINNSVDNTDEYVQSRTDTNLIFDLKTTFDNIKNKFETAPRELSYYIDDMTKKIKNTSSYTALRNTLQVTCTEKIGNNFIATLNGHENGSTWLQISPNEAKMIDIRILDGAQVELNGNARITMTSKDLPVDGLSSKPNRYKTGITLSFSEGAYENWTNTEIIDGSNYCIPNDPDEIHFSIAELKALKALVSST